MQRIDDVLQHIMSSRGMKEIGEEVCKCTRFNRETREVENIVVKIVEMFNPISEQVERVRMGCQCHNIALKEKMDAEYAKHEREKEIRKMERYSFIPEEIKNARFKNYEPVTDQQREALRICVEYVKAFPLNEKKNIVFEGSFGIGKSHLLYSSARYIASEKGMTSLFITMTDLVGAIKSTWGKRGEENEHSIIKRMVDVEFLVLDDIGAPMGSDRMEEIADNIMYQIVNARTGKHTAFSTNLTKNELKLKIDPRTYDRMISNKYAIMYEIKGPSGRQ